MCTALFAQVPRSPTQGHSPLQGRLVDALRCAHSEASRPAPFRPAYSPGSARPPPPSSLGPHLSPPPSESTPPSDAPPPTSPRTAGRTVSSRAAQRLVYCAMNVRPHKETTEAYSAHDVGTRRDPSLTDGEGNETQTHATTFSNPQTSREILVICLSGSRVGAEGTRS